MLNTLENVFIQIPNFVFLKNTKSEYVACNANFASAAGLQDAKEIVGKTDFNMPWADSHSELYREGDQEVLDGAPKFNVLETQLNTNGEIISILINKSPLIDQAGQVVGVIGSYMEYISKELIGHYDQCQINIPITKLESDYLFYIAQGFSLAQISERVGVSILMVKSQINKLKQKLNTPKDSDLQKKALSLDIIKRKLFNSQNEETNLLTKREMDIAKSIIKGKTAKGIALELNISNRTVENYLVTMKEKMKVSSKYELIEKLLQMI